MLNIGSKINNLCKEKNLSQADLAKAVEASHDIIDKYERNDNSASMVMAFKIVKVFDVPINFLLKEGKYDTCDKNNISDSMKLKQSIVQPTSLFTISSTSSCVMPKPGKLIQGEKNQFFMK